MLQNTSATIVSIKKAFKEIKHFCPDEWQGDYRMATRQEIPLADRRNGSYRRHLLTELRNIELSIPRTRTFSTIALLHRFARRVGCVERMILVALGVREDDKMSCFATALPQCWPAPNRPPVATDRRHQTPLILESP